MKSPTGVLNLRGRFGVTDVKDSAFSGMIP
jgi:hypothetical protein